MNEEGRLEVTQAPTKLDEAVAQAFERAASEAQAELQLQEKQADAEVADTNDSGNNTVNEESTAEVSGQSSEAWHVVCISFWVEFHIPLIN